MIWEKTFADIFLQTSFFCAPDAGDNTAAKVRDTLGSGKHEPKPRPSVMRMNDCVSSGCLRRLTGGVGKERVEVGSVF